MRGPVSLALLALPAFWLVRYTLSTPTGGLSSGGVGDSDGGSSAKDGGAGDAAGDISVAGVLGCDGGSSCTVRSCKVLGGLVPRLPNGFYGSTLMTRGQRRLDPELRLHVGRPST